MLLLNGHDVANQRQHISGHAIQGIVIQNHAATAKAAFQRQ